MIGQGSQPTIASRACAVVLAGGRGTRLQSLYPDLPKPMIPASGRPFVEWVVRHLARQGIPRFVISLGHLAEVAEDYFSRRPADGLVINTVRETTPLGTGGAFLWSASAAGDADPLILTNGDSLVLADLDGAWRLLADDRVDGVVVGIEVADASRYGTLEVTPAGRLSRFCEKRPGRGLINAGVYLFRRRLLDRFSNRAPLSMELDVFPELLNSGAQLAVHACRAPFLDIGTPESVREADRFIADHFIHPQAAA